MSAIGIAIQHMAYGFKMSITALSDGIGSIIFNFSNIGTTAQEFVDYFDLVSVGNGYVVTEMGNYMVKIEPNTPFITWPGTTSSVYGSFDTTTVGSAFYGLDFSTMTGLVGQTGLADTYGTGGGALGDTVSFSYKGVVTNVTPLSDSQVYMLTGLGLLATVGIVSKTRKTYHGFRAQGVPPKRAAQYTAYLALTVPFALGREIAGTVRMGCKMALADIKAAAKGLSRKSTARLTPATTQAR